MSDVLTLKEINYSYVDGGKKRVILQDLSYSFQKGKFYTIIGASGSGKTTLLSLMAGLDKQENGEIVFLDKDIRKIGLERYRKKKIAIVFQQYNLIPYLTARENVELVMDKEDKELSYAVLNRVGIVRSKADRLISKLSGGEQQRVAIARALASDAELIFADEPTGNLDSDTEKEIIKLFKELTERYGKTVIVVTHSKEVAQYSDVQVLLQNGSLVDLN